LKKRSCSRANISLHHRRRRQPIPNRRQDQAKERQPNRGVHRDRAEIRQRERTLRGRGGLLHGVGVPHSFISFRGMSNSDGSNKASQKHTTVYAGSAETKWRINAGLCGESTRRARLMDVGRIWAFRGCGTSWVCCSSSHGENSCSLFYSSGVAFLFHSSERFVLLSFFPPSFSWETRVPLHSSRETPSPPRKKLTSSAPRNR